MNCRLHQNVGQVENLRPIVNRPAGDENERQPGSHRVLRKQPWRTGRPSMRRLPPVNKHFLFGAGPSRSPASFAGMRCCPTIRLLVAARCPRALPSSGPFVMFPPHFHSYSRPGVAGGARFQLESVVRALPSLGRSQAMDPLRDPQIGSRAPRSRPDAAGKTRVTPVTFSTRALPHAATIVVFLSAYTLPVPARCRL